MVTTSTDVAKTNAAFMQKKLVPKKVSSKLDPHTDVTSQPNSGQTDICSQPNSGHTNVCLQPN